MTAAAELNIIVRAPTVAAAGAALDDLANSAGKAEGASAAAGKAVEKSMGAARAQTQNLMYQVNDLAMVLASGASPFTAIIQQGSQIVQIFGPGVGVGAAIRTTGAALAEFLLNPLTLAVIGFAAAAAAAEALFSLLTRESTRANQALELHKRIVDDIGEAYEKAGKQTENWAKKIEQTTLLQARTNLEALKGGLAAEIEKLQALQRGGTPSTAPGVGPNGISTGSIPPQYQAIADLSAKLAEGSIGVAEFRKQLDLVAANTADQKVQALALALQNGATKGLTLSQSIAQAEAIVRVMTNTATDADIALLKLPQAFSLIASQAAAAGASMQTFESNLRAIANLVPQLRMAGSLSDIQKNYTSALIGLEGSNLSPEDYKTRLNQLNQTVKLAEAATAEAEKQRLAAEAKRLAGPKAPKGPDPFGSEVKSLQDRALAMRTEAAVLGMSAEASARYTATKQLELAATRQKMDMSPELVKKIREEADAYAAAARASEEAQKVITRMDEVRSFFSGSISSFRSDLQSGASFFDALTNSATRFQDKLFALAENKFWDLLLGTSGSSSTGLIGSIFGRYTGAAGAGASGGTSVGGPGAGMTQQNTYQVVDMSSGKKSYTQEEGSDSRGGRRPKLVIRDMVAGSLGPGSPARSQAFAGGMIIR